MLVRLLFESSLKTCSTLFDDQVMQVQQQSHGELIIPLAISSELCSKIKLSGIINHKRSRRSEASLMNEASVTMKMLDSRRGGAFTAELHSDKVARLNVLNISERGVYELGQTVGQR